MPLHVVAKSDDAHSFIRLRARVNYNSYASELLLQNFIDQMKLLECVREMFHFDFLSTICNNNRDVTVVYTYMYINECTKVQNLRYKDVTLITDSIHQDDQ